MGGEDVAVGPIDEAFAGDLLGEGDAVVYPLLDGEEMRALRPGEVGEILVFGVDAPGVDEVEQALRDHRWHGVAAHDPLFEQQLRCRL